MKPVSLLPEAENPSASSTECPHCGGFLTLTVKTRSLSVAEPGSRTAHEAFDVKVLELVADGQSDQRIAAELGVPLHRVKRSVREWMIRLYSPNRTAAVVQAISQGFLSPS